MRTYEGIITKKEFVSELKKHQKADNFVRGDYWNGEKGCAVGCSLESISRLKKLKLRSFNHYERYEDLLGIPEWLARVEDTLFEGMSVEKSKSWPVEFAQAIHEGVDLDQVKVPFLIVVLEHSIISMDSVKFDAKKFPDVKKAIEGSKAAVRQMIEAQKSGDRKLIEAADSAADSARSAAYSADSAADSARSAAYSAYSAYSARSAVYSAARSAAYSAYSAADSAADSAYSAADSARSAAYSAAYSAYSARSAAYSAAFDYYANELLKLLKAAK